MGGLTTLFAPFAVHRVPEGHVAVYYRGGALLDRISGPGFHMLTPMLEHVHYVQTTVQTDKVTDIPCSTSGGTVIQIDLIEVVNQLKREMVHATVKNYTIEYDKTWIYDKIHHEVNQICSRSTLVEMIINFELLDELLVAALQRGIDEYAPGIKIIAVRVTRPRIPKSMKENYTAIEKEMIQHGEEVIRQQFNATMEVAISAITSVTGWDPERLRNYAAIVGASVHIWTKCLTELVQRCDALY